MRQLFNISDEEKQRILEMHSPKKVMIEQTLTPMSINVVKVGDQANLYDDMENKNLRFRVTIDRVKQDEAGTVNLKVVTSDAAGTKKKMNLTFKCNEDFFFGGKEVITGTGDTDEEKDIKFFGTDFKNKLRQQFCQKTKAGIWVPKAKFASVTMDKSEPMV